VELQKGLKWSYPDANVDNFWRTALLYSKKRAGVLLGQKE
jgi:hypothetical protein